MSSFFTFTEVAARAAADARGDPWPHLVLTIRPHHVWGFNLHGDRAYEMDQHHERAAHAMARIRAYCALNRCTAHVKVYDRQSTLFKEIKILRPPPVAGCV